MAKKKIEQYTPASKILTVVFALLSVFWMIPIFEVVINSFKENTFVKTETFAWLTSESFVGFDNFVTGMTFGGYPFSKSVFPWDCNTGQRRWPVWLRSLRGDSWKS